MLATLTVVGLVILVALTWFFFRTRQQDMIEEILMKRRPTSKIATRAEYVEGIERVPVALSLAGDSLYYQNPDMDASFELNAIDEIEYDDELSTGQNVEDGSRALRLRAHGRAVEFVLSTPDCQQWMSAVPPHRTGETNARAV